jgi:L-lysine 6-transaminase
LLKISAASVHEVLRKHLLVDGYDIVPDLAKSRDCYLADARDGRRYLDFFSFHASQPLGFNHPRLAESAFVNKLGRCAMHKPSNSDMNTIEMAEFVETFARVGIPPELPHLFLVDGGTLAVENALKTAFDWKVRKNLARGLPETTGQQILHFRQAFHGRSGYTLSLTNTADPRKTMYFPKFNWPRCSNPSARFPLEGANLVDTEDREIQAVSEVRQAFRERPHDIAAVIVEPIQCEGGDNHFRAEFLQELRRACDEFEALLIFDEVQTGVAATGKFWCYQHFDLKPDIVAFGKKVQVCGILAGPRIDEVERNVFVESSRINSTWGGNLVDMLRATRILEVIEADDLCAHARTLGASMLSGLRDISERDERMTNVRGRGLLCAFDLPNPELRDRFRQIAREKGFLLLGAGTRSLRLRSALTVKKSEVEHAIALILDTMKALK